MTLTTMILANVVIIVVLGLVAKFVKIGSAETTQGGWNFNYSTSDLIILAVIGTIAVIMLPKKKAV